MEVRCRKTVCKHNNCCNCGAKEITVSKDSECKKFVHDKDKKPMEQKQKSNSLFEVATNIIPYKRCEKVNLKCDCEICVFNKGKHCVANGITVGDDKNKACCCTFIDK